MDEMSFVVTTLERINAKLDKHDDKIDMIVQAMQQLVKVDTENKEIKEALSRLFKRVELVENNQNTDGCSAHKAFVKLRETEVKGIVEKCNAKHEELTKEVHTLAKTVDDNYEDLDTRLKIVEGKGSKIWEVARNKAIEWSVVFVIGAVLLKFGVNTK